MVEMKSRALVSDNLYPRAAALTAGRAVVGLFTMDSSLDMNNVCLLQTKDWENDDINRLIPRTQQPQGQQHHSEESRVDLQLECSVQEMGPVASQSSTQACVQVAGVRPLARMC